MTGSWKSTVLGVVAAFFGFVLFSPESFSSAPWLLALAKFAFLGGLAGLGIVSKDYNVTGKQSK